MISKIFTFMEIKTEGFLLFCFEGEALPHQHQSTGKRIRFVDLGFDVLSKLLGNRIRFRLLSTYLMH